MTGIKGIMEDAPCPSFLYIGGVRHAEPHVHLHKDAFDAKNWFLPKTILCRGRSAGSGGETISIKIRVRDKKVVCAKIDPPSFPTNVRRYNFR